MELFDTQSRIAILEHEVKNVSEMMKELRKEQKEQHEAIMKRIDSIDKRIDILERWRYMVIGGALVIGYMVAQFVQLAKVLS
jgi:lipid II:glycine glycyltransferase (peptidoglycan interpeptide bridge formation enzyme)